MAMQGMDVEQVESLGNQLKHQGGEIQQVIAAVDGIVGHLRGVWWGQDAIQFEEWWTQQHRPHLQAAAEAVSGLGQSALNNANDQRAASGR